MRKLLVAKQLLHDRLRIIKGALDRERVHVVRPGAGHLALLQGGRPSFWIQDKNGGARFAEQTVDGRGTGVARGRAEHIDAFAPHPALVFVKIAEQLQRKVLERERGAVEQLQHKQPLLQTHQRSNVTMGERRVATVDHRPQRGLGYIGREPAQKLETQR
jgi:hypothetical protein